MANHDYLGDLYSDELNLNSIINNDEDNTILNNCDYYDLDKFSNINFELAELQILHLNIHGLQSKTKDINFLLDELKESGHEIDVILLCETFMTEKNKTLGRICGYDLKEYFIRENSQGGGIAIFAKSDLKCIIIKDLIINIEGVIESCFIELITKDNQKNIVIGEIYRIPGTNEKIFLDNFDNLLNKINKENKSIILGTDQNIDFIKLNSHKNTSELFDISLKHNVLPTVIRPTRITHNSSTLIDNIYLSNNICKNYKSGIIISDISDHFPCFLMMSLSGKINRFPLVLKSIKLNFK